VIRVWSVGFVAAAVAAAGPAWAMDLPQPTVAYAAERVISVDDESEVMKVSVSPGRERLDRQGDDGEVQSEIIRHDRGIVWFVVHGEKIYMEMPLDAAEVKTLPWGDNVTMTRVGAETINGMAAVKFRLAGDISGNLWMTAENIPLRMVGSAVEEGVRYEIRFEQRNVIVGAQAPRLFEIPAGFKKVEMSDVDEPAPAQPRR
jgi:hypothetical protein